MTSMIGAAAPSPPWTGGPHFAAAGSTSGRAQPRRAAASAGRIGLASRCRSRQAAPLKARFATVAKPASSSRRASSRCAVRSAEGRSPSAPSRTSSRRAGRRGGRAARPPPPRARRPARRAPARGRCGRAARARRGRAGPRAARARSAPARRRPAARGLTTSAPRLAYSAGIAPRVDDRDRGDRERQRLEVEHQRRDGEERERVRERAQRPAELAPAQPRGVDPRPPVDGRGLGQDRGGAHPPAIGRRRITSSAPAGSSRTCSACPSPVLTTA